MNQGVGSLGVHLLSQHRDHRHSPEPRLLLRGMAEEHQALSQSAPLSAAKRLHDPRLLLTLSGLDFSICIVGVLGLFD